MHIKMAEKSGLLKIDIVYWYWLCVCVTRKFEFEFEFGNFEILNWAKRNEKPKMEIFWLLFDNLILHIALHWNGGREQGSICQFSLDVIYKKPNSISNSLDGTHCCTNIKSKMVYIFEVNAMDFVLGAQSFWYIIFESDLIFFGFANR